MPIHIKATSHSLMAHVLNEHEVPKLIGVNVAAPVIGQALATSNWQASLLAKSGYTTRLAIEHFGIDESTT